MPYYRSLKCSPRINLLIACSLALATAAAFAAPSSPDALANQILNATNVKGGLVVHLNCGDGTLTAALGAAGDSFLVHGIDPDSEDIQAARSSIRAAGLYGRVSAEQWTNAYLPYANNLAKLVVAEEPGRIRMDEIMRVLAPGGVAYIRQASGWTATTKPRPDDIDEWTHFLHDPTNNAVAQDEVVDYPFHVQWLGGPKFARHHEHLASISGVVSSAGRLFYIVDESTPASIMFSPTWFLEARDAFSGVKLWKRPIPSWHPHLWRFRTGPPEIARRLVAVGDRVYATLGYNAPVECLDAASGETIHTYSGTEATEEILCNDGALYLLVGNPGGEDARLDRIEQRTAAVADTLERWSTQKRPDAWDMQSEDDVIGTNHLTDVTFSDGIMSFHTENDPIINLNLDGQMLSGDYDILAVRMYASSASSGEVFYWSPDPSHDWHGFALPSVRKGWHTYVLDLNNTSLVGTGGGSEHRNRWGGESGKINQFRFDPVLGANVDAKIDWIRLLKSTDRARQQLRQARLVTKHIMAVDADTGATLWKKPITEPMPVTLAVADGRAYIQNADAILCFDAADGKQLWRHERTATLTRQGWAAPTLVVYDGVILTADRIIDWEPPERPEGRLGIGERLKLRWAPYELIALSAEDGKPLWTTKCGVGYHAPVDIFVAQGLVWIGKETGRHFPDFKEGRDPHTGEVKRRLETAPAFTDAHHHRCYRNKATEKYILVGRTGVEYVDLTDGDTMMNHWVRGTCQYGILPCNGLLYAPSHSCACYIQAKLSGFYALAGRQANYADTDRPDMPRLTKGPAYAQTSQPETDADDSLDWPTHRHDEQRSGAAAMSMGPQLTRQWAADIGAQITAPTVAKGKVFIAAPEKHAVHALDEDTGERIWQYTAGGRIDSPPTIYRGMALFGCADGHVYCLRASDGALIWRFRAAPRDRRIVSYNRVESVWPVHGSVLIHDGDLYFVAGRSSYLDGGVHLYRLNPTTGDMLASQNIYSRDPRTGAQKSENIHNMNMEGALPDILSSDGSHVFMRHGRHDPETLERLDSFLSLFKAGDSYRQQHDAGHPLYQNLEKGPHLFSPTGFLDDTWWHRTYWVYGTFYPACCPFFKAGTCVPAGRILAFDDTSIYGFARKPKFWGWWTPLEYHLFATAKIAKPGKVEPGRKEARKNWQGEIFLGDYGTSVRFDWSKQIPLHARALTLAGETLFIAGPPDVKDETKVDVSELKRSDALTHEIMDPSLAAWRGEKGAALWAVSAITGDKLKGYELAHLPVFDGIAAANGRLYISTQAGRVLCLEAEKWEKITPEFHEYMAQQRANIREQKAKERRINSFTEGFEGQSGIDWEHVRGSFDITSDRAHSGDHSLRTVLDDMGIAAHYVDLEIEKGNYVLEGWLYIETGDNAAPSASPALCEGGDFAPLAQTTVTERGKWTRFEIPLELTEPRMVRVNLNPRLHKPGFEGAVLYWDDIVLTPQN